MGPTITDGAGAHSLDILQRGTAAGTAAESISAQQVELVLGVAGYMMHADAFPQPELFLRVPASWRTAFWTEDDNYLGCQASRQNVTMWVPPAPLSPALHYGGGVDGCAVDGRACIGGVPNKRARYDAATKLQHEHCASDFCDGHLGPCVPLYDTRHVAARLRRLR
jgi:hypothetical protein